MRKTLVLLASTTILGCPMPPTEEPDASVAWRDAPVTDAGPSDPDAFEPPDAFVPEGVDADFPDAFSVDAYAPDARVTGDAGMPPADASVVAAPSTVARMGSGGFLLRGTVLAPSGPISPGEVLIVGDTIQCVAASCASHPMAGTVTVIETNATISAGLIDGHNHATYDFLPEWVAPDLFDSRYVWRSDPSYSAHIRPESDGGTRAELICPSTKWAELRSIVHGTTTIQGQSPRQACVDRLARNADHYHGLGTQTLFATSIAGPCEGGPETSATAMNDTWRASRVAEWNAGTKTRLAVHMSEGVRGTGTSSTNVLREFDCYLGRSTGGTRDYRINLLRDSAGMPYGTAYFIHGTGLTPAQIDEANAAGAYFIWSPSSNMILYGDTTDIGHMVEIGAVVGMGPDWTVSGTGQMLGEMRFGYAYGRSSSIPSLTPRRIHQMATIDGARAVDLDTNIGSIEVGKRADLVIFGRTAADPYRAVLESRSQDIRLVMIDGLGYYGDLALETATSVNAECENFDACGSAKFLCVANTPGSSTRQAETYEDVRTQLYNILQTGYASVPGSAYGRGAELRELVECE
jgi:cytosine/adenosine deaminase-related metal-dependent hydrolase